LRQHRIDQHEWSELLLCSAVNAEIQDWLTNNICDKGLSWDDTKSHFFITYANLQQRQRDLEAYFLDPTLLQQNGEGVAMYYSRFSNTLMKLEFAENRSDDPLIIYKFIYGLKNYKTVFKFLHQRRALNQEADVTDPTITSMAEAKELAHAVENELEDTQDRKDKMIRPTPNPASSSSFSPSYKPQQMSTGTKVTSLIPQNTRFCRICNMVDPQHPKGACPKWKPRDAQHHTTPTSTESKLSSNPSSTLNSTLSKPKPTCFHCGEYGHAANHCSARDQPQTERGKAAAQQRGNTVKLNSCTLPAHVSAMLLDDAIITKITISGCNIDGYVDTLSLNVSILNAATTFSHLLSQAVTTTVTVVAFSGVNLPVTHELDAIEVIHGDKKVLHKFYLGTLPPEIPAILGTELLPRIGIRVGGLRFTHGNLPSEIPLTDLSRPPVVQVSTSAPDPYIQARAQLMAVIKDALHYNEHKVTGECNLAHSLVTIDLKDETPIYVHQYPIPLRLRPKVDEIVAEWRRNRHIVEQTTPNAWNLAITAAAKKDDFGNVSDTEARVCLDTRPINAKMLTADRFPLPKIMELLRTSAGSNYFSMLDLKEAFLQFRVAPQDQHKLAFTWQGKQYKFAHAPFGLKHMSCFFQRVLSGLFADMPYVRVYVDNITVVSATAAEHATHVLYAIQKLNESNLKLKPAKSIFCCDRMEALGHVVSPAGLSADPRKVQIIQDWPIPTTGEAMQSFIGVVSFLRSFVPNFSTLSKPFTSLYNDKKIIWTPALHSSLQILKDAILHSQQLIFPDPHKHFLITCDASDVGIGAVLSQPDDPLDAKAAVTNIIAIESRTLQSYEKRYSTYKKELLAIIFALRKFHTFIAGVPFTIQTDHKALIYLMQSNNNNRTLLSWIDNLLEYNFDVIHRAGVDNELADKLSRLSAPILRVRPPPMCRAERVEQAQAYEAASAFSATHPVSSSLTSSVTPVNSTNAPTIIGPLLSPLSYSLPAQLATHSDVTHDDAKTNGIVSAAVPVVSVTTDTNFSATTDTKLDSSILDAPDAVDDTNDLTKSQRHNLITSLHNFSHFGAHKLALQLRLYGLAWTSMENDIASVIASCHKCAQYNAGHKRHHPLSSSQANHPFHIAAMDIMEMPLSSLGCSCVLVLVDYFTNYVVLRALPDAKAITISTSLLDIFSNYGVPLHLQMDTARAFYAEVMTKLTTKLGIDIRSTTPYLHFDNGRVERAIQTARSILNKTQMSSLHWAQQLNWVQYAINATPSSVSQTSPFMLMFNRLPNIADLHATPDDYLKLQKIFSTVVQPILSKVLHKRRLRALKSLNLSAIATFLPSNTLVYVRQVRANKSEPLYNGPYTVVARNAQNRYLLKDKQGQLLPSHFDLSQLKVAKVQDDASATYTVKQILEHKFDDSNNLFYLVDWQGPFTSTWEPATNILSSDITTSYWLQQHQLLASKSSSLTLSASN
jgi:hypothetical protein